MRKGSGFRKALETLASDSTFPTDRRTQVDTFAWTRVRTNVYTKLQINPRKAASHSWVLIPERSWRGFPSRASLVAF